MKKSALILACFLLAISYAAKADATPQEVKQTEQLVPSEDEIIQFRNSAELGDANAMFKLGEIYSYGEGVTEDANIAMEWFLKAAQVGNAEAMYKLGDMYYFGKGVTEDTNEAIIWYTKAANAGHSESMYELGDTYHYGWGVKENPNKAEEWYSKAISSYRKDAEAGDGNAMQNVAKMYENGEGVPKDYTQALQWYRKAAEAGSRDAMYRIGLMYENGKGIGKDYGQAKSWYKKAIELGDDEANMRLVVIFVKEYYKVTLWGFLAVFVVGGFIYAAGGKQTDEDVKLLDIDNRPKKWGVWLTIRRYTGASFIYLIYWITLWGAFTRVVGATLSGQNVSELVEEGVLESVWDYGWGDHYIWFLIIFCLVAYSSGALAGATAKKKGAIVASIANLPVIVVSSLFCIFLYISKVEVESPIAWKIVLPLSIMCSIYFVVLGGTGGQKSQSENFADSTIFGIRSFHWFWLWLVSSIYIQCLASCLVKVIFWDFTSDNYGLIYGLVRIVLILPVFVYGYAVFLMYEILNGERLENKSVIVKILAFIGCYIGGLIAGGVVELIIYKIFSFISSLFS